VFGCLRSNDFGFKHLEIDTGQSEMSTELFHKYRLMKQRQRKRHFALVCTLNAA
jgi:hypothetical protein